jgi:hypothetical protein
MEEDNPGNKQKLERVEGKLPHRDMEVVHRNDWDPVVFRELEEPGDLEELCEVEGLWEAEGLEELLEPRFDLMVLSLKVQEDVVQWWLVE